MQALLLGGGVTPRGTERGIVHRRDDDGGRAHRRQPSRPGAPTTSSTSRKPLLRPRRPRNTHELPAFLFPRCAAASGSSFLLLATVAAAVVVISSCCPETYVSTVSLLVDNQRRAVPECPRPRRCARTGYMQTQMDVIQSQGANAWRARWPRTEARRRARGPGGLRPAPAAAATSRTGSPPAAQPQGGKLVERGAAHLFRPDPDGREGGQRVRHRLHGITLA